MDVSYSSKLGWSFWSYIIIMLVILVPITIFIKPIGITIIFSIILLVLTLYPVLLAIRTKYTFEDDKLVIRGIIRKKEILYDSVKRIVEDSKDPVNYGLIVLSMDRIGIYYGKNGYTLISPKEKKEAARILKSRCCDAKLN